jgi:hypothetical protein
MIKITNFTNVILNLRRHIWYSQIKSEQEWKMKFLIVNQQLQKMSYIVIRN